MAGEPKDGFFDFSIKREDLYALGFSGWSQFVQREVPPDRYPAMLKVQVLPKYEERSFKEPYINTE
jgi:hypothetical protein